MIVIEGIIGAGKTTLARQLNEYIPRSQLFLEPVEGNPYLSKFYEDQHRWGLVMQYYLMTRRYQMHVEAIDLEWNQGITTIFDRSIYGDAAFAYMLNQSEVIDNLGYESYMQHRSCMERFLLMPQLVIYLDTPVELAMEWINKRSRGFESGISADYLHNLTKAYQEIVLPCFHEKTKVVSIEWGEGCSFNNIKEHLDGRLLEYDQAKIC